MAVHFFQIIPFIRKRSIQFFTYETFLRTSPSTSSLSRSERITAVGLLRQAEEEKKERKDPEHFAEL